ncbi:PPOX class F420-dependent enzyme [Mycobacteroides chelonae]|uniref:PPOX class F420-dependent enzyme n=1 Tax=Mycobacteroides chelonae TaxID=1774 RepID=A0A1S1M139_MYCCH|nr:PPOX class F420-dependent oxidoreductase [Mycobacteroides chelonae]OHU28287.1 PPOX class F420-dependent enzyme [Mycobacteroides chelonae]OHU63668.1 PPOX class F420-dependent enzyme [Mycobacteroides chelonae]OHU76910.1 PPOX class F420-dependent enzyme [Mycobacteroides chelonae]QQG88297.1 PPOX class F420-dependent oxidoreductase [Mycobacteroides chelonae]QQG93114.1 PPOX class F420-dependent oxidoreductase [Mycobacteroides chelonae]
MELHEAARTLIGAGADATLVTINPDGTPQVSVVWVALQSTPEGDELVAAHLSGNYKKLRNIRRDPHVAVTILAPSQPGQQREYLSVTGSARVVEGGAPELLSQLAIALLGSDEHFPPPGSPEGYLTRIRVESVGGHGPWAPQP